MSGLILKGALPPSFTSIMAEATVELMESKFKETSVVATRNGVLELLADKISIRDIYDQLVQSIGIQLLDFMGLEEACVLETLNTIRRVSDQNCHVTGFHYDWQVANAVFNSLNEVGQSTTVWIPMQSITSDDAGLIVFDRDVTLRDIHQAAGEEGYFSNIPYANASSNTKRGLQNPKYEKYFRSEDALHIVDLLSGFECDEERLGEFYALHKICHKNLYRNLKGRYSVTEMDLGDVLLFDSNCYHGTYIPGDSFVPRISIDLRVVSPFVKNDETDIYGGYTIAKT